MTHSGGKPHEVGDRGQRYEVSFYDPDLKKRVVLGWCATDEGAKSMVAGINAHPRWKDPQVKDRHEQDR